MRSPPNEVRHFVHKRLARAARGFVTSGFNPLSAVGGFLAGDTVPRPRAFPKFRPTGARLLAPLPIVPKVRRPPARSLTARPGRVSAEEKEMGRNLKFSGRDVVTSAVQLFKPQASTPDCGFGRVWNEVTGKCVFGLGTQAGRDDTPIGDTVMGRYGAGEQPGNHVVNRAVCRRGMVLGDDGICYNRTQITNKERAWPRGRRPLLTGGDMRAISTAARAGKRLTGATKRLQKIGLMKKPAPRARRITSGSTEHHHHN